MAPQAAFIFIMGIWNRIKDIKIFWALLRNWGFVKQSYKTLKQISESAISRGHITCEETKECLGLMKAAFERGLIDFNGIDEADIVKMLQQIETNLVCSVLIHERKIGVKK